MLVSVEEAEDATQEVLFKLWKNNETLEKLNNIEAFATTMIKNQCLDVLSSKRAGLSTLTHNNYEDNSLSINKIIENNDHLYWINKIIDELPMQQKLIVQLRDIEEQEFAEIAKIVDMNETAVRVALSRARKTIKEKMQNIQNYGS
jgi:RNA polymerase sigma-70 factor (ECF subfamily)